MRNIPEGLYSISAGNFEAIHTPVMKEVKSKEYVYYGELNLYPQLLIELYDTSAMHHTAVQAIKDGIFGEGIETIGNEYMNGTGETLDDIFEKIALDYTLFQGYALNVIWNKEGNRIAEIYHLPMANVRSGKMNEEDTIDTYHYSSDWKNTRKYKPVEYKAFDITDNKGDNASQIFYFYNYTPGNDYYPLPAYVGAVNDIDLDARVSRFHNANISNGLAPSMFVQFRNGIPTPDERRTIYDEIQNTFAGEDNAGRAFISFSEPGKELQVTPIENANTDLYGTIEERIASRILTAHRITSPSLLGISNGSGFSSVADEIKVAYAHFEGTVIEPKRKKILTSLGYILKLYGLNVSLEVQPSVIEITETKIEE
tara:strand:+ start:777 stop:1886 length:1110 start_codon:yes stop_codon:yes gene_type:complete